MILLSYPALIEPGDKGGFVVTFRDAPGAITEGSTYKAAIRNAEDALGLWLVSHVSQGAALPKPSPTGGSEMLISPAPPDAFKIVVLDAAYKLGFESACRTLRASLGAQTTDTLLDPMQSLDLETSCKALELLGRRIIIGFEAAA